ncbi:MAG: hypothetical protein ACTIAA_10830 [Microbacterium sp.]
MSAVVTTALDRTSAAARTGRSFGRAPVRIAHLGLGAFHRAHQAWYTDAVDEANEWGIRAFTGRSAAAAEELAAQDGLYTLIERSGDGDSLAIIDAIVDAVDGARVDILAETLAAPETALVTLTITEAGYAVDGEVVPTRDWMPWHPISNGSAPTSPTTTSICRQARRPRSPACSPDSRRVAARMPDPSPWSRATTCRATANSRARP